MPQDDKTKKKNGDQIKKDISAFKKAVDYIEKSTGTKVFKKVMKTFGTVEKAVDVGEKTAKSAKEVSKEVQTARKKFVDECVKKHGSDEEFRGICQAEFVREFGKGTSDVTSSVAKKSFEKIIYDMLPDAVCSRIEKCAKEMEK